MTNKLPNKTITMENIEEIYEYIFAPYVKQLKLSVLKREEGRVLAKLKNSRYIFLAQVKFMVILTYKIFQ